MEILAHKQYHWTIKLTFAEIIEIRKLAGKIHKRPTELILDLIVNGLKHLNKDLT